MKTRSPSKRLGATALLAGLVLLTTGAGVAAVLAAPTAITGPVSAVGPTSAAASGTVNPNGQSTTWHFEYGTSTSYGRKTSSRSAGSGTANVQVSGALTGLAASTTYHYRLVATNGGGTTRGGDGIFTTPSPPSAITGSSTSVTVSSATLNGTVDPNGRATTWYFQYGTGTGYGSRTPAQSAGSGTTAAGVAAAVSRLRPGRLYHYRLVATSDAGTSRGADRTFSTFGPPTVVTGPGSSVTHGSARLNGNGHRQRPGDDLVLRVRDDHALRQQDHDSERRQGHEARERLSRAHATPAGNHLPLPARRDELCGDEARGRCDVRDGRVDACGAGTGGRVRPRRHALGPRAERKGGRVGGLVRRGLRQGLAQAGCDARDRRRRRVAVPCEAADPHVLPRQLERLDEPQGHDRCAAESEVPADRQGSVLHAGSRGEVVQGPTGSAPAPNGGRPLGDGEARPAEAQLGCDLPREAPAGQVDTPRRDEREPGRPRLPCGISRTIVYRR